MGPRELSHEMTPLIEALLRPDAYPHAVRQLKLLETHISWVILTGEFAYKIKKPVRYNFVDYSTLELRRRNCEEELRLNRRLAPDLYLEVVPIAGPPASARVGVEGAPCEFAVRMRQFEQQSLLEAALFAGTAQRSHFDTFGRRLAAFHRSVAGQQVPEGLGTPDRILRNVADVWEILHKHAEGEFLARVEALQAWRTAEECRLSEAFACRRRDGFVREGHGDLHLGNLLLLADEIVAFDGIEFNPSLRWIDVLSEVAFLVMDLVAAGRRDIAFTFLNAYLEETGDYAGLNVFRYYAVYRAAVRAAVTLLRGAQVSSDKERVALLASAERYLGAAEDFAREVRPTLTITHGVSGSGKSFVTAQLFAADGSIRLRSDVERKRMAGLPSHERAAVHCYSPAATAAVYQRLADLAQAVLQSGFSVIADATFLKREQRARFGAIADACGVPWRILDCQAPPEVLRERVRQRAKTGGDPSDATIEVLELQLLADEPLDAQECERRIPNLDSRGTPA